MEKMDCIHKFLSIKIFATVYIDYLNLLRFNMVDTRKIKPI